jgi:hypothetical protein
MIISKGLARLTERLKEIDNFISMAQAKTSNAEERRHCLNRASGLLQSERATLSAYEHLVSEEPYSTLIDKAINKRLCQVDEISQEYNLGEIRGTIEI